MIITDNIDRITTLIWNSKDKFYSVNTLFQITINKEEEQFHSLDFDHMQTF